MVSPLSDTGAGGPGSVLCKTFSLNEVSDSALLHISALGLYRAFINDQRVGHDLLTPGWTNYDARLAFQTYEVGQLLRLGENRIEIWLADGWLRSPLMWTGISSDCVWGDRLGAIAELMAEGQAAPIVMTDESWKSGVSPIRKSGIYFGEIYDARHKIECSEGVEALPFDTSVLIAQECQPVRELTTLSVQNKWADAQGRTIYDLGQNIGGYVHFTVQGDAGARIVVEHAEILNQGAFYNENFRSAEARIEYELKGDGVEDYRPIFTFQGFRYARVTIEGKAELRSIEAVAISSINGATAEFTCGNDLVNRLVLNTIWSQRGNFIDIPTDCPQRDERLGWTGDAQVFAGTACYLAGSHDFFVKYLRDVMVDQLDNGAIAHVSPNPLRLKPSAQFANNAGSIGWGDVISVLPYTLWLHYADTDILHETFPAMVRWNDYVWSISDGPVVRPPSEWSKLGFTFGDWLQPKHDRQKALPTIGDDAAATLYLYISSAQIAEIARRIGHPSEAEKFEKRAKQVKAAYQKEFITATGRLLYDDQTSYALSFLHDLIPDEHKEAAKAYFLATIRRAHGRIGTGFIGTPALLPALVKIGEPELAADVFLQEDVPGWLFQIKMGATTIWERWDGIKADGSIFEPSMNSYNHYAYGAVCQWLFESVAGFRPDPDAPGFENVLVEPVIILRLSPVKARHESKAGDIKAEWTVSGDQVLYEIEVPHSGMLLLSPAYQDIVLDGVSIHTAGTGKTNCRLSAGKHSVRFRLARQ